MSFSNSSIKAYEQCPFKYKLTRINRLQEPAGDAANRGKEVHEKFEKALIGLHLPIEDAFAYWNPYLAELRQKQARPEVELGVDREWGPCGFSEAKVWLRGVMDVIYQDGTSIHVLDWKTGKERDYADQLKLYATLLFATHPDIDRVTMEICYIDICKQQSYGEVSRNTFDELKTWVTDRITKIENDDVFAPKPSYGCKWCHFRKSNGGPCKW